MQTSDPPYETLPAHLWAGNRPDVRNGTILEDAIINNRGWRLYHPELAPTHVMIMAHWADGVIAVSARRSDGQWFRARFGQDGTPGWEETGWRLSGWRYMDKGL
jgi:hypothetical protein